VNEVAARSVRTEAVDTERVTEFGTVARVARQRPEFVGSVRELALLAVATLRGLGVSTTQFGLVTTDA